MAKIKGFLSNLGNLRISFLFSTFFVNIFMLKEVSIALICFVFFWSIFFIPKINKKFISNIKYSKITIIFIIFSLFTTFFRFRDNFFWNILMVYYSFICFFIFYGSQNENNFKKIKSEAFKIFSFFTYIPTIFSILSISIAVFKDDLKINNQKLGIDQRRLVGIYNNANVLGFACVLSIISSFMLYKYKKKNKTFCFNLIIFSSLFINSIALFLSDSQGALLFLLIYFISLIFCVLVKENKNSKLKFILFLFISLSIMVIFFATRSSVQSLFNNISKILNKGVIFENFVEIGRGNYEITSGRSMLFIQGLKLFCNFPIIGTGVGNIKEYADRIFPGGLLYNDLHNGYLTILVSWGTIGFVIVMSFLILVALFICRTLFKSSDKMRTIGYYNFFSLLVAYSAYNFCEITLLSSMDFRSVFFWIILGYAVCYAKHVIFLLKEEPKNG